MWGGEETELDFGVEAEEEVEPEKSSVWQPLSFSSISRAGFSGLAAGGSSV